MENLEEDSVLTSPLSTRNTHVESDGLSGYIGISFGKSSPESAGNGSLPLTPFRGAGISRDAYGVKRQRRKEKAYDSDKHYGRYEHHLPNETSNVPQREKKKTLVLHQIWGEGTPIYKHSDNKPRMAEAPSLSVNVSKTQKRGFGASSPPMRNPMPSRLVQAAEVYSPSVDDLHARLNRMKDRVSRTLSNRPSKRRSPQAFRPSTTSLSSSAVEGKRNLRPLHVVRSEVKKQNIKAYGDLGLPNQPELRKWIESYTYEQEQYASFALHAEMHLKRLALLGPLPNRLALAVSMDILGRLPSVVGRYSDIVSKIHRALYEGCYIPYTKSLEEMSSVKESKIPTSLIEYFNKECYFLEYEKAKLQSTQILEAVKKLGVDARATLQFMDPVEIQRIAKDVLLGLDLFNDEVRFDAIKNLGPKDVAKAAINTFETSKRILTSNQTIGLMLSMIKAANPEQKGAIYDALMQDTGAGGLINWLVEEADDILQEDVYRTISEGFAGHVKNTARTHSKSKAELAEISLLKTGSSVEEGGDGSTKSMEHGLRKKSGTVSVESFLESATEEDVELLRKVIMKADEEHGVRWKLILPWEEDDDGNFMDEKGNIVNSAAANQSVDTAVQEKIAAEKNARKVISQLRMKVHQGKHRKRRKKKLKISMAKFKLAARTVMMASNSASPEEKFGSSSTDVSDNAAVAFDAHVQVSGADIDSAMYAFENKTDNFMRFCEREKKKLINIFETLLADEIAHAKTSTVEEWNKAVEDHGLKIPLGLQDEVLKTLGAANGHGAIDAGEWLKYLDTILVVKSKHEDEIMSKMGMSQKDIEDKNESWLTHLADMVELANEKAKKKKKRLMIRLNKRGLPPSFAFSISSTRFNAQDFSRAANRNLTHTLQEIGDIYPEYFHSEICQAKTREPFSSFIYSHYLSNFGLPKIADVNLLGLAAATVAQESENLRVKVFGRFYLTEEWDVYLEDYCHTLIRLDEVDQKDRWSPNKAITKASARKTSFSADNEINKSKEHVVGRKKTKKNKKSLPSTATWFVGLSTVLKVCSETMHTIPIDLWDAYVEGVEELAVSGPSQSDRSPKKGKNSSKSLDKKTKARSNSFTSPKQGKEEDISPRKHISPRKMSHQNHRRTSAILLDPQTRNTMVDVDRCMMLMLDTLAEDRMLKVKHLASLFTAADVDGNGELSFSEFVTLIHSLDPMMLKPDIMKIYRESIALNKDPNCEMTTASFVAAVEAHGLMHLAVENSSALGTIVGTMADLKSTWSWSKPFVTGTFESLLRDLEPGSDLLVFKESGDKSLQGIKDRILAFEKLMLENASPQKTWQSYWIVMREFWSAVTEGPGVQTLYPHEVGADRRTDTVIVRQGHRNTDETEPSQRKRRPSLVHVLMPDTRRITVTMPSMNGRATANI